MRETGYYWVRTGEEWDVAYYDSTSAEWEVKGWECPVREEEFDEINEHKIPEPK